VIRCGKREQPDSGDSEIAAIAFVVPISVFTDTTRAALKAKRFIAFRPAMLL
jgi:hypothetical protein